MSDPITSYSEAQRKYIPEQYKRSTNLLGVIDCFLALVDQLETAIREIGDSFTLDDAIGPMLDFYGAFCGFTRNTGETDEQFRARIRAGSGLDGIPTVDALYNYFEIALGVTDVGIYPCWPAGFYAVFGGDTEITDSVVETVAASGVDMAQGTFLCCEDGEPYGLIVLEDNGQPLVIDQRWPDTLYNLVDSNGNQLVDDQGDALVMLDFLTT